MELIINRGSLISVASMTLIDKLEVPTKVYPTPYTLQWFKQGSKVIVSKQALILFSVDSYFVFDPLCFQLVPIVGKSFVMFFLWMLVIFCLVDLVV